MRLVAEKRGTVRRLVRSWLSKLLTRLVSDDPANVIARVIQTGRCEDCGTPVSRDIMSEDSVTFVCTNEECGHKYEVTDMQETTAEDV